MQPIEPNTPPDSPVWRVIHHPMMLLLLSVPMVMACAVMSSIVGRALRASHADAGGIATAVIGAAIFFAAYWGFVRFVERRAVVEFAFRPALPELAVGIVGGVAILAAIVGVMAALGAYRVIGHNGAGILALPLSIGIFPGFSEEIVLRGLFFRLFERWLGSWVALLLSAFFFGFGHIFNPGATWVAAVGIAFEAGIMLAALYMITQRLWMAVGLHAAWNFAEGGIFGTPVSGLQVSGLLRPWIGGSDLVTGGKFGPEASLPGMAVATAVGVVLLYVAWRKDRFIAPSWVRRRQGAAEQA
jgi:membrane protease YdiL (CAAX protease family)